MLPSEICGLKLNFGNYLSLLSINVHGGHRHWSGSFPGLCLGAWATLLRCSVPLFGAVSGDVSSGGANLE